MKLYGLIGYPLSHSFSKKYFTEKFNNQGQKDEAYENFPIDSIDKLGQVIKEHPELVGLNVTIPYKQQVLKFLDEVHDEANEISAVNTIRITRKKGNDIHLAGHNTDVYGFRESIKPWLTPDHKKALVLGTGGASKAIKHVFASLNIDFLSVSRSPKNNNTISYQEINADLMKNYTIIVNTSPLGTYPDVDTCPDIPYEYITNDHLLYDLVYNPEITAFLEKGKQKGAVTINGLQMLHLQAERSYAIWNKSM